MINNIPAIDSNQWNNATEQSDSSKIYHLYQWGNLLEKTCKHKLFYLFKDSGVLPLALVKSYIFGDRLISLPFADYGGPCGCRSESLVELISKADKLARELNVEFLEIRSPDEKYFSIFQQMGFTRRDDYFTYILPLDRKVDELWKIIGNDYRRKINKAEKNNITINPASNEDDVKKFFCLYLETMKKLGSPPQPYQFFYDMWKMLYPKHLIMPLLVHKNECIAGGIFFLHKGTIHYAYGCSSKKYLNLAATNLMMWWIIKWGAENNHSSLDFGRTRADSGHDQFKRHWGGNFVSMPYFYKFNKSELKVRQETRYKTISNIWRKYLPIFAANKIGPWIVKQIG
jgi:FemAB-related protein (PEP-CTERM system-associated)